MATEVGLFLSREHPNELEQKFIDIGGMPIAYSDFPGSEFMSLVVRHSVCPTLPNVAERTNAKFSLLEGAPEHGDSVTARAIMCSDVPQDGGTFFLAEVGPLTVSRSPP